jgi:hypothetical protein
MIKVVLSVVLLMTFIVVNAREPQYYYNAAGSGNYFPLGSPGGVGSKVQLFYKPSDFSGIPPSGTIERIYFKAYPSEKYKGENTYTDITIKLGSLESTDGITGGTRFISPLHTVYHAERHSLNFNGEWLEPIKLQEPYRYDSFSNLVLEISVGKASSVKFISYTVLNSTRRIWGVEGADVSTDGDGGLYAVGFDISPLAVAVEPGANEAIQSVTEQPVETGLTLNTTDVNTVKAEPTGGGRELKKSPNKMFLIGTGILGLLCMGVLLPFLPKTRKIAYWAFKNPTKTKWLLVGAQVLTSAAGLFLGKRLYDEGIVTSETTTNALFALATAGTLFYPKKQANKEFFWKSYRKQKMLSLLMALTGVGLVTNLGNRIAADREFSPVASSAMLMLDKHYYDKPNAISYASYTTTAGQHKEPMSKGGTIALRVLATVLMVFLLVLITVATCWLICIEQPVWAVLLFFGGGGAVVYGYIRALRALSSGPRVRRY